MVNVKLIVMRVNSMMQFKDSLEEVPGDIAELLEGKPERWRQARSKDGDPYGTWQEFRADKGPYGLNIKDKQTLLNLCHDHAVLPELEAAEHLKRGPDSFDNNVSRTNGRNSATGNTRAYTKQRLGRERPDLLKRVEEGELSANAAAIEAGFRRPTATFHTDDVGAALHIILKHYSKDQILEALR